MSDIIRVENLRKVYRLGKVEVAALRGVNLRVEEGEFVSLVGPSGCGKSTLLHVIGGLTPPTAGRVQLDGTDLGGLNDGQRTELRTQIKKVRTAVVAKDKPAAQQAFREAASVIDRLVGKGLVHKNAAARYKSGLNQKVRTLA